MRTRDGMRIVAAECGNEQAGQGNWVAWWCDDSGRWDVGAPWVVTDRGGDPRFFWGLA